MNNMLCGFTFANCATPRFVRDQNMMFLTFIRREVSPAAAHLLTFCFMLISFLFVICTFLRTASPSHAIEVRSAQEGSVEADRHSIRTGHVAYYIVGYTKRVVTTNNWENIAVVHFVPLQRRLDRSLVFWLSSR